MLTCSVCGEPAVVAPFPEVNTTMGGVAITTGIMYSSLVNQPYCAAHDPFPMTFEVNPATLLTGAPVAAAAPVPFMTPSLDTAKLLGDLAALRQENERLRAALEDARGDIAFLERCLATASENAAKALAVVRVVAEADNSDNSVCYQLCSMRWREPRPMFTDEWEQEHTGPCIVDQSRALLAPTAGASAQESEASSDDPK